VFVDTVRHVVYLNGTVDSELQRDAAESVARKASGVTNVVNEIGIDQ
jgi:osmotically-inducible protein OsmY